MRSMLLIGVLVGCAYFTHAQSSSSMPLNLVFRDTIADFVFDSLDNDLGDVAPVNTNNRRTKRFMYLGAEPVFIVGQQSGDPHFICDYPKEPLKKGVVYSITVCFWFQNGKGRFNKTMSLKLSNGQLLFFKYKGQFKQD